MSTEIVDAQATFTISGPPAQVSVFRKLLTAIDVMCSAGASRSIEVVIDGDGATQLDIREDGRPLSEGVTEAEGSFYIWGHMRSSTLADLPEPLRHYSVSWRERGGRPVLVVEVDGCGPPEETGD